MDTRRHIGRTSRILVTLAAVATFWTPSLQAQTGSIAGRVTGGDNLPLAGILVTVDGTRLSAVSARSGRFQLLNVPSGSRTLVVEALGFATQRVQVTVVAGGTATPEVMMEPAPILLEGLDVTGQRLGQALAIQQQRTSGRISNVVAAEHIGRFPDPNTAEALQRIPGVTTQRDQGEGRFVVIRGAEPRLNGVSINGDRIPAPEGDVRFVALDVIPADVLGSIEVSKTLTPDQDGDAIGGSVNLVTKSALRDRQTLDLTIAGGFNNLTEDDIQQYAGTFGQRFGEDQKFGLLLGGSYYKTDRGSDNIETEYGEEEIGGSDRLILGDLQLRDYTVFRERLGLNANFDVEFDERSSMFVRGIFNKFDDQEFRRRSRIRFDKGDFNTATQIEDADIERELKDRFESQQIWSISGGGTQALGGATLDYRASFSHAEEDEPDRSDITFVQGGVNLSQNIADRDNPTYTVNSGEEFDNSAYEFDELVIENNFTQDEDFTAAVDLTVPLSGSTPFALKFGGKFRDKSKSRDADVQIFDGFEGGDFLLSQIAGDFEDTDFFFDRYRVGQLPDPDATRRFTTSNRSDFELDADGSAEDSDPADYEADERIWAGYAMATIETGNLTLIPGVRFEVSDVSYVGREVTFDESGDFAGTVNRSGSNDYTSILPSMNLRLGLDPQSNLRAAVTRSIGRPNYGDLSPSAFVNREDEVVELGNTELEATTSTNVDLLYERYFQSIGVITAGVFYKRLDNYIFERTFDFAGGTFDGFEAVQPTNSDVANLFGFEVAWNQQLTFLPGALNGMNIFANYTFTDAETEFEGRTFALPGQVKHVGNVSLGYEKFGFTSRVALTFQSDYIDQVGDDADEDEYFKERTQLDASAAYQVTPNASLFVELINLTNEGFERFAGTAATPLQREFYSWWGHFGVKLTSF